MVFNQRASLIHSVQHIIQDWSMSRFRRNSAECLTDAWHYRFPLFAPKQAAEEILQGALTVVVMALQDDWRLMDWKTGGACRGAGMNIKEDWEEN